MTYRRNNTLEILKLFAAYMVVFIHVPFYGRIDDVVDALARFAVPFFFLVSGFYSYGITRDKIKRRIAHILFLLVFAVSIHIIYNASCLLIKQDYHGLVQYFGRYLNPKNMLKLLLFNRSLSASHLWYLYAILYIYIIRYFTTLFGIRDKLFWVVSVLGLCLHLFTGEFLSALGIVIPNYLIRNFAFMGIPFFGLGMLANKHQRKLAALPNFVIVISLAVGALLTVFSRYFFRINDLYLGSVFILFALVIVFIKFPNVEYPPLLTSLGGCNTYIYILHLLVANVIKNMLVLFNVSFSGVWYFVFRMVYPLVVCVVSTAVAYAVNKIILRVEEKIKHGGAI